MGWGKLMRLFSLSVCVGIDLYHLTGDQEKEFSLRQQSSTIEGEIQSGKSKREYPL